jgi:hemerythrin
MGESQNRTAFVEWKSSYFVDVPEIDLQHQEIVVLLNKLYDAMARGEADTVQRDVLRRLVVYTRSHFAAEEGMMARAGYPELDGHRLQHMHLTEEVLNAQQRIHAGETIVTIGLLRFLKDWLLIHIGESDRKIGVHLRSKRAA